MLCEAERPSTGDAHRFKQSVAQQKPAVARGNDRLFFRNEISIEENLHALFLTQRRKGAMSFFYLCDFAPLRRCVDFFLQKDCPVSAKTGIYR
jgi:hypothetical protein